MKGSISDEARVEHIWESISEIERALVNVGFDQFVANHVLRIAVVKWLEIIGEAASKISEKTRKKNVNIEWEKMIGLRHVVVHEYFGINYDTIWQTATISLLQLKKELDTIITD